MGNRPFVNAITLRAMAQIYGEGIMEFPTSGLQDGALYPILEADFHGSDQMQCVIGLDGNGSEGHMKMPIAVFARLPKVDQWERVVSLSDPDVREDQKHLFTQVLGGLSAEALPNKPHGEQDEDEEEDEEDIDDEDEAPMEVQGYVCVECGTATEEEPESPLYECGNCGRTFTRETSADGASHRCPDCNKFASKCAKYGCIECASDEMEERWCWRCLECGQVHAEEEAAKACCKEED